MEDSIPMRALLTYEKRQAMSHPPIDPPLHTKKLYSSKFSNGETRNHQASKGEPLTNRNPPWATGW